MTFEIKGQQSDTTLIELRLTEDGGFEVVSDGYYLISVSSCGEVTVNESTRFGLKYKESVR